MLNDIQIDACKVALNKMIQQGHFSICTIDSILKVTGGVPSRQDYDTLRLLHCVDFKDFTPRMRMEFPMLLKRVLESPGMELEIRFKPLGRPVELLN